MKAAEKAALRKAAKTDYLDGMSYRQIAAKYGVGVGSVARWAEKDSWDPLDRMVVYEPSKAEQENGTPEQAGTRHESHEDFNLLRETALKALKKINDLLDLDEALAPRDIKSITGSLLDLKSQLNALSPRELREMTARLNNLEKQTESDKPTEPITVRFVGTEGAED